MVIQVAIEFFGAVSKSFEKNRNIGICIRLELIQKTTFLDTAYILSREVISESQEMVLLKTFGDLL